MKQTIITHIIQYYDIDLGRKTERFISEEDTLRKVKELLLDNDIEDIEVYEVKAMKAIVDTKLVSLP